MIQVCKSNKIKYSMSSTHNSNFYSTNELYHHLISVLIKTSIKSILSI